MSGPDEPLVRARGRLSAGDTRTVALEVAADAVDVEVGFAAGTLPTLHRTVGVRADLDRDLREQLAAVVDRTPVTVLLRDGMVIVTHYEIGSPAREA